MDIEKYLSNLGITEKGTWGDDAYVIDIRDSNEYGKMFTKLERLVDDQKITEMQDNTLINVDSASIQYRSEEYQFNLLADFNENIYSLVIAEI